jgi:NTE family protein
MRTELSSAPSISGQGRSTRVHGSCSAVRVAHPLARGLRCLAWIPLALLLPGCFGYSAANVGLEKLDPGSGYRPTSPEIFRPKGKTAIYLAFSGGGTRAAAFSYGVLEGLRDARIWEDGKTRPVLDEVDTISGVSGGSFPAAYYGLYGDRIFERFEQDFLKRNVQTALILRALRPKNLIGLMTPWVNRSALASQYYDSKIFHDATFADLTAAKGPTIYINATDLSSGNRFTFTQGQFDVLCSDLDQLHVSVAVAASSAVPALLSPVTLRNHAGTCGYVLPAWLEPALASRRTDPRAYQAAQSFAQYHDPNAKKFVHLIDGGVSDNLGLRAGLDLVYAAGGLEEASKMRGTEKSERLVVIVVNAQTENDPKIDLSAASPGFAALMNSVTGAQINRSNFETLRLLEDGMRHWGQELQEEGKPSPTYLVDVSFENLEDPKEVQYFKRLPTSFKLSDEQVDRLREAGRRLLRDSPEFQRLLREMAPPEGWEPSQPSGEARAE